MVTSLAVQQAVPPTSGLHFGGSRMLSELVSPEEWGLRGTHQRGWD